MIEKKTKTILTHFQNGSKWLELANLIARKNRDISIIKDFEKDPSLKKIHAQRDKICSKNFHKKK